MTYTGIDFGGSTIRVSEVNPETGELIGEPFVQSLLEVNSNKNLNKIIFEHVPENSKIGISAAGNIDEENLVILESANSKITSEITFARDLAGEGYSVTITNDMKAAVQGAARYGEGKNLDNVLLATYSSGFNCAVTRKGVNVTTAEFGHQPYKNRGDLFCGCGRKGHLEVYLSGNGAAAMAKQFFFTTHLTEHPILADALRDYNAAKGTNYNEGDLKNPELHLSVVNSIGAKNVYSAFKKDSFQEPQRSIQESQAEAIASSFGMMNSAYNPLDVIVTMGSQTKDWDVLFEKAISIYNNGDSQLPSLNKPKIVRTELPEIGVQGAVGYYIAQKES